MVDVTWEVAMPQSAYTSPAVPRASTFLRHPATASLLVLLAAVLWASIGFASSLFTNDIIVSDESYGVIHWSIAGPAILLLLCAGAWLGSFWRANPQG